MGPQVSSPCSQPTRRTLRQLARVVSQTRATAKRVPPERLQEPMLSAGAAKMAPKLVWARVSPAPTAKVAMDPAKVAKMDKIPQAYATDRPNALSRKT